MASLLTAVATVMTLTIASTALAAGFPPPLNAAANAAIKDKGLSRASHGIYAVDAKTGQVLIDIDGNRALNPASNVKMITAAVALKELGGDYRFVTRFSTDSFEKATGTVHHLYIRGNGDPFLVTEIMEGAVKDMIRRGIRQITGDIIVDESYFDGTTREASIDNHNPYAAAAAATSLNFNSVRILVDRDPSATSGYEIKLDAPNDYVTIINRLKAVGRGIRLSRTPQAQSDTVTVAGGLPKGRRHFEDYVNVSHPALYLGSAFKTAFVDNGVPVTGIVREGRDRGSVEIVTLSSKELRLIVDDMNRFSNNFVAEQLLKHVGAAVHGPPGTSAKGIRVFEKYLGSLRIRPESYTLVNGSGLSRDNRLSARQLVTVLADAYGDTTIKRDYINSLSIAGEKGTIRKRHTGPLLKGKLYGKTGSLNGVSTLTGFVPMANGHTAIFAILTNGASGYATCHKLQDAIATMLALHR